MEQEHLEQAVEARLLLGGDVDEDRVATPILWLQAVRDEILARLLRIGARLINLVDRNDDRNASGLGMVDRLKRLRHHAVVGSHHEDGNVGQLGTAGAQGGKRLVARRVEERDLTVTNLDLIRANVLRNATGLARDHAGRANRIEQRRLAVVDMAHHGDHRCARHQRLGIVFDHDVVDLFLGTLDRDGALKLGGNQLDGLVGQRLRDRDELAKAHHHLDDLGRGDAKLLGVLLDGHTTRHRDGAGRADDNLLFALFTTTTIAAANIALARPTSSLRVDDNATLLALRHSTLRTTATERCGGIAWRRRRRETTATRGAGLTRSTICARRTFCGARGWLLFLRRCRRLNLDCVRVRGGRIGRWRRIGSGLTRSRRGSSLLLNRRLFWLRTG